ncbi:MULTISPECIES: type VII secretion target [unclassified Mycobacterium]|uniref:type VII secretion target n=1 Tax=unclassified Mycobacterium TaxID=2642494 RepID=UPI000A8A26B9|nr:MULTISPECIES: type VII secretion target [unclassified Mycobacterium]
MTEVLRVDTGLVREAGGRLRGIAAELPEPPAVYRPTGSDALSAAIAAKVTEVVDPVLAQMPVTKEELTKYALNVVNAANTYDAVDAQLAEEILKRLESLDDAARTGRDGGSPGGVSVAALRATGTAAGGATSGNSPVQGAAQQPMQLAQQAVQAPMQMAGMAGAIPQAMTQGMQQAMQQAGQLSEAARAGDEARTPETTSEPPQDLAAPGDDGERAPDDAVASNQMRSAEGGPEIAL